MVRTTASPHRIGSRGYAAAALVVLLGLTGCGTSVAGSSPSPSEPPPLRLRGTVTSSEAAHGLGASPTLAGPLPTGPDHAAVYRFAGGVDEAMVGSLAGALGLTSTPDRRAHGWVVRGTDAGGQLVVRDDGIGAWAYQAAGSGCALPVDPDAAAPDDAVVGCAVTPPDSARLGPDADTAKAAAVPVLTALGLPADLAQVTVSTGGTYVRVDPTVDGLPTSGLATQLTVTRHGIVAGEGSLATPARGADYPIVSAKAAFAALSSLPQPEIAVACPDHEDGPPLTGLCARTVVTGAALGLALRSDADSPVLVPAWLFATKDGAPLTMVAVVADFFLTGTGDPGTGGSGGTGGRPRSVEQPGAPGTG